MADTEALSSRPHLPPTAGRRRRVVGFLFAGGAHQMLHIAPVAAALACLGTVDVVAFVTGEAEAAALVALLADLGATLPVELLPEPRGAWVLGLLRPAWRSLKLPRLLAARARLARVDVLVTAERTSTILTRLPGKRALLVHIPHGAGDRARGFERRIARFDHVIVSGEKDRARMIAEGLVAPDRVSVSGSIKLAAVTALAATSPRRRLFEDDRPVVLYNPHFAPGLSSWPHFGPALIAAFARQDVFNLIVAPHVRLFADASSAACRAFAALAVPERIIVDPGSPLSCDMTYTRAASIYCGDVSSQVYEFIQTPRPCVFFDRGVGDWSKDPSFAFWHFGEVIADPANVLAAVGRAAARHGEFRERQHVAAAMALGDCTIDAATSAASIVARLAEPISR